MARKTLKSEALSIVGTITDTALIGAALACGTAFLSNPNPFLAAGAIIPTLTVLRRNWPQPYYSKQQRRTLRSMTPFMVREDDPDIQTATMCWKDRRFDNEFYFGGLGLPTTIPESRFVEFVKVARRRQTYALYGTKYTMQWTGYSYQQIKINWVLSEGHFTKRRYPRFLPDEYWACMTILGYGRVLVRKGQGDAGHLIGDKGVDWYVEKCKYEWLRLLDRTTPHSPFSQLLAKIRN